MAYYYVEDIEASMIVLHILKVCSKYFPVPTIIDGIELKQKLDYLNKLYTIWTENIIEDSSYQSEVYKHICGNYQCYYVINEKKIRQHIDVILKCLMFDLSKIPAKINIHVSTQIDSLLFIFLRQKRFQLFIIIIFFKGLIVGTLYKKKKLFSNNIQNALHIYTLKCITKNVDNN